MQLQNYNLYTSDFMEPGKQHTPPRKGENLTSSAPLQNVAVLGFN